MDVNEFIYMRREELKMIKQYSDDVWHLMVSGHFLPLSFTIDWVHA